MKMFNKNSAEKMKKNSLNCILSEVFNGIEKSSKSGLFKMDYYINVELVDFVRSNLESLGYRVFVDKLDNEKCDASDNKVWLLTITWNCIN